MTAELLLGVCFSILAVATMALSGAVLGHLVPVTILAIGALLGAIVCMPW